MLGFDVYSVRARIAPAVLTAAPVIALGIAALPLLPGVQKLWSLIAVGLSSYAALVARAAGNRIQPSLYQAWGGAPTTSRLRFRDNGSRAEVQRRHADVERVLGLGAPLPNADDEGADPDVADREYDAAIKRLLGAVREHESHRLLQIENRNYGFSRNLLGLKPLGLKIAWLTIGLCLAAAVAISIAGRLRDALPLVFPATVALMALGLWRQVDMDFPRSSADAYADRLIEALDDLPPVRSGGDAAGSAQTP